MPTLTWIGKEAVENHHKEIPYRLLHCDASLSVGDPGSGNLLVEGLLRKLLPAPALPGEEPAAPMPNTLQNRPGNAYSRRAQGHSPYASYKDERIVVPMRLR